MYITLLLMLAGVVAGFALRNNSLILKINETLLNITIYILLLLLGIAVGTNEKIIHNLYQIGFQALIITAGAIAGSVAFSWLIFKTFFRIK